MECLSQRKEIDLIGHKQSPWHLQCIPTPVNEKNGLPCQSPKIMLERQNAELVSLIKHLG